jgi:hypothetical protein
MKNVAALAGEHLKSRQIPVVLVQLSIPGAFVAINDTDADIWLDTSTLAGALVPHPGGTQFRPGAGLSVPTIAEADAGLSEAIITVSNVDGFWWNVINSNAFREAPATIWNGNITLAMNEAPEAAELVGVFVRYAGFITTLRASRRVARVTLRPGSSALDMKIPYRTFPPALYRRIPAEGSKITFGFTERTL